MKFDILSICDDLFYIILRCNSGNIYETHNSIANFLGLSKSEYMNILKKNGYKEKYRLFGFKTKVECKKIIEILEPYLILNKLMGGI